MLSARRKRQSTRKRLATEAKQEKKAGKAKAKAAGAADLKKASS
jgi:hypothetical protein